MNTLRISPRWVELLLAVSFSAMMTFLPWVPLHDAIYGAPYTDRTNYYEYFTSTRDVIDSANLSNPLEWVTKELLWHAFIGYLIRDLAWPPELVFSSITFSLLLVFTLLTVRFGGWLLVPLLVNPLIVDLAFSQLRLAFALSLMGVAVLLMDKRVHCWPTVLFLAAPLVHTASVIFIVIGVGIRFVRGNRFFKIPHIPVGARLFLLGAALSAILGPLREPILMQLGDRRAEYTERASSLLYLSMWIMLFILVPLKRNFLRREAHVQYAYVILSLVTVNSFFGGYSLRFLAAAFPFLISALTMFRGSDQVVVFIAFLSYAALQWLFWLRVL